MRILSRENLQKLFLAGILLGVPLYQKFPLLEVPGTFVRIRIEDFLIFFISIYVAVHYLPRLNLFFKKSLERSIILFWIVGLVSLVSAIFVTKTVIPHIGFLHWARRVEYMIVVFLRFP